MARKAEVKVRITGESKGAEQAVKKTETSFQRMSSSIKRNALAITAAIAGTVLALRAMARGMTAAITAAVDQERAVRKMNAALKSAGDYSKEASADMEAFAKSLASTVATTDQAVLAGLALAKSFGQSNEQAKLMVATAHDFGAAADLEFTEALRRIGRASHGSTEDVAKFAPEIANLTKEELLAGKATEALAARFKGLSEESVAGAEGAIRNFVNALGELKEAVGEGVTKNKEFQQSLKGWGEGIEGNREGVERVSAAITNFVIGAGAKWIDALQWAADKHTDAVLAIDGMRSSQELATASTQALLQVAHKLGGTIEDVERMMEGANDATEGWDDSLRDLHTVISSEVRVLKELADTAGKFADESERLGIVLERDVNAKIAANNDLLDLYARRLALGEIKQADFARAQLAIAAANSELRASLLVVVDGVDEVGSSSVQAAGGMESFGGSVRRTSNDLQTLVVNASAANAAMQPFRGDFARQAQQRRSRGDDDWVQIGGGAYTQYTQVVQDPDGRVRVV